ncbi:MAG: phosphatidylserine decarboxylase family protein [Phycisphaerales bacterium]|nr:MAG: phosphatidylserine decarboxylase family protein [Phycisphaerales bacterium]
MKLSTYGLREIVILVVVFGAITAAGVVWYWPVAVAGAIIGIALLLFFRDPPRPVPDDPHTIVAPADGKVTAVERIEDDTIHRGPVWRISIFLSIFDVHINRAPYAARVTDMTHKPGRYVNAMSPKSAVLNESMTLVLEPENGLAGPLIVRAIAGLIARRIVCAARAGDRLERGQKFGMIKFGSRTDMTLPADDRVVIETRVGDKVKAGLSVVARIAPTEERREDACSA